MNLELTGKLIQVMPEVTGTGKNGAWVKQEFIVETTDSQFPRKVCFSLWGEKAQSLQSIEQGSMVKVSFNLESREYNNRWYTDARAWRLEQAGEQGVSANVSSPPQHSMADAPDTSTEEGKDDLPF